MLPATKIHFAPFNPIALRTAKTPQSFGRSECNRAKCIKHLMMMWQIVPTLIILSGGLMLVKTVYLGAAVQKPY